MTRLEEIKKFLAARTSEFERMSWHINLSPDDIRHLSVFADGNDVSLAAKAVHLASLFPGGAEVVMKAARNPSDTIKVAAAGACRNIRTRMRNFILRAMLEDSNTGVRKTALDSIGPGASGKIRKQVIRLSWEDPDPRIRGLALSKIEHLRCPKP